MEILEIMKQRHSVRQYSDEPIEEEKKIILSKLIEEINMDDELHIQVFYDEPKCFDSFMAHYGKFSGVNNYIALVGKKTKNADVKMGYYGEKLVLKTQELGLNTCWVAMTHGKSSAIINKGEKLFCLISLGYGKTMGVSHKSKTLEDLSNYTSNMPDWFKEGVLAAMLAPTAMNQQKFYFELLPTCEVKLRRKKGFYSKIDLGIVKYHFEEIAGKKCIID